MREGENPHRVINRSKGPRLNQPPSPHDILSGGGQGSLYRKGSPTKVGGERSVRTVRTPEEKRGIPSLGSKPL